MKRSIRGAAVAALLLAGIAGTAIAAELSPYPCEYVLADEIEWTAPPTWQGRDVTGWTIAADGSLYGPAGCVGLDEYLAPEPPAPASHEAPMLPDTAAPMP